jgi:hypothetical protein
MRPEAVMAAGPLCDGWDVCLCSETVPCDTVGAWQTSNDYPAV